MVRRLDYIIEADSRGRAIWIIIGRRLRLRRTQLRIGVNRIADQLGVSLATYKDYEAGNAQTPASVLEQIAHVLGVPLVWFFQDVAFDTEGDDEPTTRDERQCFFVVATVEQRIQALAD